MSAEDSMWFICTEIVAVIDISESLDSTHMPAHHFNGHFQAQPGLDGMV